MAQGLNVSRVVNVTVNLSPLAAGARNFGAALKLGDSDVIDTSERYRSYTDLDGVAEEFGTTAPEYFAAALHFSQQPQPNLLYIGRWARTASSAVLHGGVLSLAEQDIANFTAITAGSMAITVDGTLRTLSSLNFSATTNLNGVASIIDAALTGATVTWDAAYGRFNITSGTSGTSSTLSYASATGSGTDISSLLKLRTGQASAPVAGIAAETPLAAVQTLADMTGDWYEVEFAASVQPTDNELVNVAAFVEGSARSRIFGHTISSTTVLDRLVTNDLASRLKALNYKRSFTQYSSSSPYAISAFFARAATVNFEANNTTITLKFKQEPGVVAELLTESQANTLKDKNTNVFVKYQNDTAIIQEGKMANGYFFDEVHGTDWLQNAIQTAVYNLLYQSQTKIPQTDEGITQIVTTIEGVMARAVNNGLVAPGIWNGPPIGQLRTGQTLSKGFYVYAPPVATQAPSDREARKSPPIQVAAKLAGAVHFVDVLVAVNRGFVGLIASGILATMMFGGLA